MQLHMIEKTKLQTQIIFLKQEKIKTINLNASDI